MKKGNEGLSLELAPDGKSATLRGLPSGKEAAGITSLAGNMLDVLAQEVTENPTGKRFWLFAGRKYYPRGGMKDFKGQFDSVELAHQEAAALLDEDTGSEADWAHILDSWTGEVGDVEKVGG